MIYKAKYWFLYVIIMLISPMASAQNYVANPSFELQDSCPNNNGQVKGFCKNWYSYTKLGTPDYFDTCGNISSSVDIPLNQFGYQYAIGGAYGGFYTFYYIVSSKTPVPGYEYLATEIQPLIKSKFYEVSLSVNLTAKSMFATDGIGVLFYENDVDTILTGLPVSRKAQVNYSRYGPIADSTNWVRLKGYLLADSNYDHIVIGQFKDSFDIKYKTFNTGPLRSNRTYYYIDSIVVKEASNLNIEVSDSLLCAGDIISVGCFVNPIYFNSSNVYYVELSDKNGSFSSPLIIGSLTSNTIDSIQSTIPISLPQGEHYRMRLRSTNPSLISADNGFDIQIGPSKALININSNAPVCYGDTFTITANTVTSGVKWYWWRPYQNPIITSNSIFSKTVTYLDSGMYYVTASNGGCLSEPNYLYLNVLDLKSVSVNINLLPGYHQPIGSELVLSAITYVGGINPSYQWFKNGVPIQNAIDTFYKVILGSGFTTGDSICVEMTSSYQCAVIKTVKKCISYDQYMSVSTMPSNIVSFKLYPNPTSNLTTISGFENGGSFEIYDLIGRKLMTNIIPDNISEWEIDMSRFPSATYIIKIVDANGNRYQQIMVKE